MQLSKYASSKKKDLNRRYEKILYNIRAKLTGTRDEIFIDQYVRIITYARNRFIHDYEGILEDLEFIVNCDRPTETLLSMLSWYMIALDVLHDIEKVRIWYTFDINDVSNIQI